MAIIAQLPDGAPSLLVTTAALHPSRVYIEKWHEVDATELAALLVEHDVDVLLNPGAPASMRLIGDVFADYVTTG